MPADTVAEAYLEMLVARGIEYLFGNGGTDFGPIVEAYAKRIAAEEPLPRPVTVPHEITAVAMAHGYTMVTGRPQAVMVHTIPGTANALSGIINASRAQIPMLFTAGRTPLTEGDLRGSRDGGIHWAQESFDQGSMVREWVKWDYELRSGSNIETIVDRALAITKSEPAGPVYLTLPREILSQEIANFEFSDKARMAPSETAPAPATVAEAAKRLAAAKHPIAITQALGRDPRAVPLLVELAELLGMPVFESNPARFNFPQDHPLHVGFNAAAHLADADAVVLLETDVPWAPKRATPRSGAAIIAVGEDPIFSRYPVRGFPADIVLAGSPRLALSELLRELRALHVDTAAVSRRNERWQGEHDRLRAETLARAEAARSKAPIQKQWFSQCVQDIRDENTALVNELGVDPTQLCTTKAGTYYSHSPAGSLGWAEGAALGVKLADPDKAVICTVGDGSYIFGTPAATHWVSRAYNLPVLFIVYNNAGWNAVANSTRGVAPDGWATRTHNFPFTDLSPSLDFEMFCQAAGGYGERVEDPEQVPAALKRGLDIVRNEKRQVLLNVIGTRPR
jgi:acetolactate synthase-1/2/3 large subunit